MARMRSLRRSLAERYWWEAKLVARHLIKRGDDPGPVKAWLAERKR